MKIDKNNITAVILAGGRGSRLGGIDKGLVEYQGKPLIQTIIERVQPQVGQVVINANRNIDTYKQYTSNVLIDEISDFQGPLAGISTALKFAKTDYILILPSDGPNLPLNIIEKMTSALDSIKESNNCIAVAHDGNRLQPLHALIPTSLSQNLEEFLTTSERKVQRWYDKQSVEIVDFSEQPNSFFNINKKEQLLEYASND